LTEAHDSARQILTARRDSLETVTRRLLEIEVMEGEELRRLLGLPPSAQDSAEKTPLPPIGPPGAAPPASRESMVVGRHTRLDS
jgi:hypothetical protein